MRVPCCGGCAPCAVRTATRPRHSAGRGVRTVRDAQRRPAPPTGSGPSLGRGPGGRWGVAVVGGRSGGSEGGLHSGGAGGCHPPGRGPGLQHVPEHRRTALRGIPDARLERGRMPWAGVMEGCGWEGGRGALEGPQRRPQRRLGRRLEEVAKAVGGGYCRLQTPVRLALGVRGTVAGHRLGALERGGGVPPPLVQCKTEYARKALGQARLERQW